MAVTVGVDFGTRNTEIYVKGKGIVMREPTVAAVDTQGHVIAVGTEALLIRGRAPGTVTIRRPITDNNITDFNLAAEILDHCLEIAVPRAKKHVFAAAKYGFGSENRELLRKALEDCRTGHVELVDSAIASLLGSGLGVSAEGESAHSGTVVCDIGAGSVEASYIRAGELLRAETYPNGGEAADTAIAAYIRRKYGLAITNIAAREAKHHLSLTDSEPEEISIAGLDGSTGMPRRIEITTDELLRPCAPQIEGVADTISTVIANLPRHGTAESDVDRIILVGGGAAIPGIAEGIGELIGREVIAAGQPLDCTISGIGMMIAGTGK